MTQFERRKVEVPDLIRHKWSAAVASEGYTPFPKRLLRCLSGVFQDVRDLQVVMAIVDYRRPNLSRPPSVDYLAFNAGMPVDKFKERLNAMKERGWLLVGGVDEAIQISLDGLLAEIERQTPDDTDPFGNALGPGAEVKF